MKMSPDCNSLLRVQNKVRDEKAFELILNILDFSIDPNRNQGSFLFVIARESDPEASVFLRNKLEQAVNGKWTDLSPDSPPKAEEMFLNILKTSRPGNEVVWFEPQSDDPPISQLPENQIAHHPAFDGPVPYGPWTQSLDKGLATLNTNRNEFLRNMKGVLIFVLPKRFHSHLLRGKPDLFDKKDGLIDLNE